MERETRLGERWKSHREGDLAIPVALEGYALGVHEPLQVSARSRLSRTLRFSAVFTLIPSGGYNGPFQRLCV